MNDARSALDGPRETEDFLGIKLENGVRARLLKSRKSPIWREVKWIVADKVVVIGTRSGRYKDGRYLRVRPTFALRKRDLTSAEVEAVASTLLDVAKALEEPLYG